MLKSLGINDLMNFDFMDPPPTQTLFRALEQAQLCLVLDLLDKAILKGSLSVLSSLPVSLAQDSACRQQKGIEQLHISLMLCRVAARDEASRWRMYSMQSTCFASAHLARCYLADVLCCRSVCGAHDGRPDYRCLCGRSCMHWERLTTAAS